MKWTNIEIKKYNSQIDKLKNMSPYELLEITENSEISEIKAAYRKKMKIYHPDKNTAFSKEYGENVSKILNDAYDKLLKKVKQ